MGEAIRTIRLMPEDDRELAARLRAETYLLSAWMESGRYCRSGHVAGFELEAWQRAHASRHGRDFPRLVADYLEHQRSGMPVHEWEI